MCVSKYALKACKYACVCAAPCAPVHLQLPGVIPNRPGTFGSAFLMDVHMDSGRLLKPWVSSLGAFWPAMQVLAGKGGLPPTGCMVVVHMCV